MSLEATLVGGLCFIITLLLGVIGYFLSRLMDKIDKNSDALGEFGGDLRDVMSAIKELNSRTSDFAREIDQRINDQNAEIHMLRDRTHKLFGYVTALRLKAQLKGWDFKDDDWSLLPPDRTG